jgi:endonuclease YncB( thermonuclease family)
MNGKSASSPARSGAVTVDFRVRRRTTIRTDDRALLSQTDGDTVTIAEPVRMVSVDTPEKSTYAGSPVLAQPKLDRCRQRLEAGFFPDVPDSLATYLTTRLSSDAAKRHIDAANRASAELADALIVRLALPVGEKRRKLAVMPTGEFLDENARLLAYLAPWYAKDELPPKDDPRRETFNLQQVRTGWGAFFPIYPSLPGNDDMNRAIEHARIAWEAPFGAREEFGEDLLLAYEYRACIKLAGQARAPDPAKLTNSAFRRLCVDLRDLTLRGRFDWADVPGWARLWIWPEDLPQARIDLGLAR